jgi:putative ABC transport system permease protein
VKGIVDIRGDRYGPTITVKGKENISVTELESELRGVMRSIRRLGPKDDDDFALNKTTVLTAQLDVMFGVVNTAGGFIGLLSALVGGFGIANIMFVSVKERTNLIGIQKSLGARNYFILLQFLFESIAMCLMGGLIGLGLVYVVVLIFKFAFEMTIVVSAGKVIGTFVISTLLGLISGIIPAWMASRLNPVEAIRSK